MQLITPLFFLLFLFSVKGFSQSFNPDKKYPTQQLLQDFDYMATALEKAHPGLYWHVSTIKFKDWKKMLKAIILSNDSLTETEFLRKATLLLFPVGCSHTSIGFSEAHEQWWQQNALLLPFNLFVADEKYYVYQNYSDNPALDFGAEILTIDRMPISKVFEQISSAVPSDGSNLSRIKNVLKTGFYYYYSLAIKESAPTYSVLCIPKGTKDTITVNLKGISYNMLNERRNALKKPTPPIDYRFVDSLDAGVLKISTFRKDLFDNYSISYENILDSVFTLLKEKNAGNLIIDLRDNGGGLSQYGTQLVSYLSSKPFEYCKNQWLTTDTLFDFMQYDIPETFNGFPRGIVKEDGGYKWKTHSILGTQNNNPNYFKGKVYVITNGRCTSTSTEVLSSVRTYKLGTIVGEEAGGSYKGNTSGVTGTVVLPNTKTIVTIPLVRYEMPIDPQYKKGLKPDYVITPTIEDWLNNRDVEMDYVLKQIAAETKH